MSSEQPRAFRWGIISTGWISTAVTKVRFDLTPFSTNVRLVFLSTLINRIFSSILQRIVPILLGDSSLKCSRRGVRDVVHKIAAVGSRTKEKAQQFIDEVVKDSSTKAYGSYQEVYDDPVRLLCFYCRLKYEILS
jgi:hypothetical protein